MATVKISELSSSANITSDDFFPVVDSSVTKKVTAALMKDFVLGRSGSNDTIHISSSDALKISANTGVNVVGNISVTGSVTSTLGFTGSLSGTATSASFAPTVLPTGTVSSSTQVDYNSIQNKPSTIPTASLAVTASYALNAVSSVFPYTGSAGISGSLLVLGTQTITGSLLTNADTLILDGTMTVSGSLITTGSVRNTQGGFTGSLFGTSSWATNALTASFALSGGTGGGSLSIGSDRVDTSQATTSTSYTDLATVGPIVTLTTGTEALVTIDSMVSSAGTGFTAFLSVEVSGATTLAASGTNSVAVSSPSSGFSLSMSRTFKISGLTPGLNTFTMKYRCDGGGPWSFTNRSLTVIAL